MKIHKFFIPLFYYERPKIFLNALDSILEIEYPNFHVHVIDDGSLNRAEPIVREHCKSIIDKFTFDYINDTIHNKKMRGGAIIGKYGNKAIINSDADHVIPMCDDDAIYPGFLTKLNEFLNLPENQDKYHFYHNIVMYNSLIESYKVGVERNDMNYFTNHWKEPINGNCKVDSTQVTYSRQKFSENPNIRYPYPRTANLDAHLFQMLYENLGPCYYSGLISQVKSNSSDNLIYKQNTITEYITSDIGSKKS